MGFDEQALTAQFLDKDFVDFCNKMFNPDPNQRMKSVGEMMSHPYMQGPTYTNEQAVQSLHQRQQQYFAQQAVDIGQLDINNVSSDSPQGSFRDVSLDVLERFKIKDFYAEIEEAYPDIRSLLREVVYYSKARSGMKSVLTKSSVQDMFEFLAMVLPTEFAAQIEEEEFELDDEEYIINFTWEDTQSEEADTVGIMLCLYRSGNDTCAVEFNRVTGDPMAFNKVKQTLKTKIFDVLKQYAKEEPREVKNPQKVEKVELVKEAP